MTGYVKLTGGFDEPVYVRPAAVVMLRPDSMGGTVVVLSSGREFHVKEPVEALLGLSADVVRDPVTGRSC